MAGRAAGGLGPARSPYWRINAPLWESDLRREGSIGLLRIEEPDAAVLMWARPQKVDPGQFGEADMGRVSLVAYGQPRAIVRAIARAPGRLPGPTWAMFPKELTEHFDVSLDSWFGSHRGVQWDFYWTDTPVAPRPGQDEVRRLSGRQARQTVPAFLADANPTSSTNAAIDSHRWWTIPASSGEPAAVVGIQDGKDINGEPVAYLAGLGTDRKLRGRGLAGALVAGVVERELEDHVAVHLGMWAGNDAAKKVYEGLGFVHGGTQAFATTAPIVARGRAAIMVAGADA
ncbi:MAG: GNAT family N-acetyltransferase [Actinomycetaceae bacterium]|nr:GNAT family N-acetyltransferase [Actinomycetaceae bacterium]